MLYGRSVMQPRLTARIGDVDIKYSGTIVSGIRMRLSAHPQGGPWIPELARLRDSLNEMLEAEFNTCLINYYRDGRDYMGWHRDNESQLHPSSPIASISLGATRVFQMRKYRPPTAKGNKTKGTKTPVATARETFQVELSSGSLLVLWPDSDGLKVAPDH